MEERLQKLLSAAGVCSRRTAETYLIAGRVTVNGQTAHLGQRADPDRDEILVDGRPLAPRAEAVYILLNKPRGYVSTLSDERGRRTVAELVADCGSRVYPVGRLDLDTEGLLLITNDGDLAHRLLSPKKHVDKVYYARCRGTVREGAAEEFARGIHLPDGLLCLPAELTVLSYDRVQDESEIRLRIREGKFHQVKRMMEAVGCPVLFLKRLSMGPLVLDENLKPGEYRPLTDTEREWLEQL